MKKAIIAMLLVLALIAPLFAQGGEETKKATFDKDFFIILDFSIYILV